jgi:hypothetical protein
LTQNIHKESVGSERNSSKGVGGLAGNPSLTAGLAYFAIVFAIGFVLGLIRIPFLVPLFGDITAVLIELPAILTLAWLVCRKLVSSMNVPLTIGSRAVMGGLALILLLSAELAFSTIVFGNSIIDHLQSYLSLAHALGLAGQFAFGLFPVIQMGLSTKADVAMPSVLDAFIANPNVREQFSITVRAPASMVYKIASEFDMQSLVLVRVIFWLREKMLGSMPRARPARGLFAEMRALGWGCLIEREGELFVAGAVCQPWQADVVFTPISPDQFSAFSEPANVKIAWTIATTTISPGETRLTTETRAVATDATTRCRFLEYWRWARFGIIPIRWILLPAIRRESERKWRAVS